MTWINWLVIVMGALMIGAIVWLAVRGWIKYPEERGKGGFPFNGDVPGGPVLTFDRTRADLPEVPRMVIPSETLKE